VLEARPAGLVSSEPFKVTHDSIGLAGKWDPATKTFVDVPTKSVASDDIHADFRNNQVKKVVELVNVRRDFDRTIRMTDVSPTGMDPEVFRHFQESVAPMIAVYDAAFDEGGVVQYSFITQQSPGDRYWNHSQHDPGTRVIYTDIDLTQGVVYPSEIQSIDWHETAHSIFGRRNISADARESSASNDDIEKFTASCKAVRDIAIEELEENATVFIGKLQSIGEKIPQIKPSIDQLIEVTKEKRLNDLMPNKPYEPETHKIIDTCSVIFGSDILSDISKHWV
jgi:hypothetical protein